MGYESSQSTKEKKRLYNFMEKNKNKFRGNVSLTKLKTYCKRRNCKVKSISKGWISVRNRRGTSLSGMHVNKRKQIDNWHIN